MLLGIMIIIQKRCFKALATVVFKRYTKGSDFEYGLLKVFVKVFCNVFFMIVIILT